MRIIGGQFRGLHLAAIGQGDLAAHLRPTTDRVRESIFNLLINGGYGTPVAGARVLDLFAGTGALGLEALSRGAAHATFVDDGAKAQSLLRQNIDLTRTTHSTVVLRRDATKLPENRSAPFTLIFLDYYARNICVHTKLFGDMAELIAKLEQRGIKWGIVTNKPHRFTVPLMQALGYTDRAVCLISGDTCTHG